MRNWPDDFVNKVVQGDCIAVMREMPDDVAHVCVTSPPYWGLRKYGDHDNMPFIGLEKTPEEWLEKIVLVFREVRRIMRPDGVLWLNLGDTYSHTGACGGSSPDGAREGRMTDREAQLSVDRSPGIESGQPMNLPHKCAEALRQDGWHWRNTIIWHKPGPMPESVNGVRWERCRVKTKAGDIPRWGITDGWILRRGQWRTTRAHEYVFMLTKTSEYFCDREAAKEPAQNWGTKDRTNLRGGTDDPLLKHGGLTDANNEASGRNPRSVWSITSEPLHFKHYAAFPTALVRKCLLPCLSQKYCPKCGTPWARMIEVNTHGTMHDHGNDGAGKGQLKTRTDTWSYETYKAPTSLGFRPICACGEGNDGSGRPLVCDPFAGSGTTCLVAQKMSADYVGIELSPTYIKDIAHKRTAQKMLV